MHWIRLLLRGLVFNGSASVLEGLVRFDFNSVRRIFSFDKFFHKKLNDSIYKLLWYWNKFSKPSPSPILKICIPINSATLTTLLCIHKNFLTVPPPSQPRALQSLTKITDHQLFYYNLNYPIYQILKLNFHKKSIFLQNR